MLGSSRGVVLLLCITLMFMCPSNVRADIPVVVNGDFETGTGQQTTSFTGWTLRFGPGGQLSTEYEHSGAQSFRFACTQPGCITEFVQSVDVSTNDGQVLRVSGWLLRSEPSYPEDRLEVMLTTSNCEEASGTRAKVGGGDELLYEDQWMEKYIDIIVPESAESTYLCIYLYGESNQVFFDDVVVTAQPTRVSLIHSGSTLDGLHPSALAGGLAVLTVLWLARRRNRRFLRE